MTKSFEEIKNLLLDDLREKACGIGNLWEANNKFLDAIQELCNENERLSAENKQLDGIRGELIKVVWVLENSNNELLKLAKSAYEECYEKQKALIERQFLLLENQDKLIESLLGTLRRLVNELKGTVP